MTKFFDPPEREGDYTMRCSCVAPQLLIVLVNQNPSMTEDIDDIRKISLASQAVNKIIERIIVKNFDGEHPKNRYYISVVGYGDHITDIKSGFLRDLDESPISVDKEIRRVSDGAGGVVDVECNIPKWIDIESSSIDKFLLPDSLDHCISIILQWLSSRPNTPAPIILNITDRILYSETDCSKVKSKLDELFAIPSIDGKCLFYNYIITADSDPYKRFPIVDDSLQNESSLISLTSKIPVNHQTRIANYDYPLFNDGKTIDEIVGLSSDINAILHVVTASF